MQHGYRAYSGAQWTPAPPRTTTSQTPDRRPTTQSGRRMAMQSSAPTSCVPGAVPCRAVASFTRSDADDLTRLACVASTRLLRSVCWHGHGMIYNSLRPSGDQQAAADTIHSGTPWLPAVLHAHAASRHRTPHSSEVPKAAVESSCRSTGPHTRGQHVCKEPEVR